MLPAESRRITARRCTDRQERSILQLIVPGDGCELSETPDETAQTASLRLTLHQRWRRHKLSPHVIYKNTWVWQNHLAARVVL